MMLTKSMSVYSRKCSRMIAVIESVAPRIDQPQSTRIFLADYSVTSRTSAKLSLNDERVILFSARFGIQSAGYGDVHHSIDLVTVVVTPIRRPFIR
jgi:hypothetical protein